jgi:predicted TIM-barrel fold metal-dependent hydrolase
VLFGSDHPILPLPRAIAAARELPLSAEAMDAFLAGARRILGRDG